jgi:MFS family permease
MRGPVQFIPIATTLIALVFAWVLARRFRARPGSLHLLWWCIGVMTYAAGTLTESLTTLLGWQEPVFRAWYITGALLGGAPLAQGTVYLLLPRRIAHQLTALLLLVIGVAATCVLLAPIRYELVQPYHLTGKVWGWPWVRAFSPFINLYAVIFLIGGAILSAVRYRRQPENRHRYLGNIWIAIGAILPGIGGSFTRFGHTEVLYVTELLGLILIYVGYRLNTRTQGSSAAMERPRTAEVGV